MGPRSVRSCGVQVSRTSAHGAKAETISESGETTSSGRPSSCHAVRIDIESLPTGMLTPSAGHRSVATLFTVSKSPASSPGEPAAAIQLADSFTSERSLTGAAARLVSASPTAIRPEATGSITAIGARSPMANASPAYPSNDSRVVAQSATGTCQGPTIWSREQRPPTVRSPMAIRNVLSATDGARSTRSSASRGSTPASDNGGRAGRTRSTPRVILGGLPSSAGRSMSTGLLPNSGSRTSRCRSPVTSPTTAKGQRSRAQSWRNRSSDSGAMAST